MAEAFFTKLESLVRWLQLKYMQPRRTTEVIDLGRILFHPHNCRDRILTEYRKKLENLGITD